MGKKRAVIVQKEKRSRETRRAEQRNKGSYYREFELYLSRNYKLQIYPMREDGNCLFRSIAHQLQQDPEQRHYAIRSQVIEFMEQNKDFFLKFLEDDVTWDDYIDNMKVSGTLGGYQELCAAASLFNLNIIIFQWNEPRYVIQPFAASPVELIDIESPRRVIMLSFHDDCHYNSLLPTDASKLQDHNEENAIEGLSKQSTSLPDGASRADAVSKEEILTPSADSGL